MKRRLFIFYSLLFSIGCTADFSFNKSKIVAPKKIKFAVSDIIGLEKLQQDFGVFSKTLEEILAVKIELFSIQNFTAVAPAMLSGELDMVLAGPAEYVLLNTRAKSIPIIAISRKNYHSIFIVRSDSNIKSLIQLKSKTIAMREIGSTSGHLVPTKMLIDAGLDPKKDISILMLKDQGAQALQKGEVDAWAASYDRYKLALESKVFFKNDFSIIAKSPSLPNDVLTVSNRTTPDFIKTIQVQILKNQDRLFKSLLSAKANQKYEGGQFLDANDADYNVIREVYQSIGEGEYL